VTTGVSEAPAVARYVLVLGIIAFCTMVGFRRIVVPVLPVYVRSFGVVTQESDGRLRVRTVALRLESLLRSVDRLGGGSASSRLASASSRFRAGWSASPRTIRSCRILRGIRGIGSAMFTVSAMTLLIGSIHHVSARSIGCRDWIPHRDEPGPALGGLLATIS
jgi:hypothetical protein